MRDYRSIISQDIHNWPNLRSQTTKPVWFCLIWYVTCQGNIISSYIYGCSNTAVRTYPIINVSIDSNFAPTYRRQKQKMTIPLPHTTHDGSPIAPTQPWTLPRARQGVFKTIWPISWARSCVKFWGKLFLSALSYLHSCAKPGHYFSSVPTLDHSTMIPNALHNCTVVLTHFVQPTYWNVASWTVHYRSNIPG